MARMVVSAYPRSRNISRAVSRMSALVWSPLEILSVFFLRIAVIVLPVEPSGAADLVTVLRDQRDHAFGSGQQFRCRESIRPVAITGECPKDHQPGFRTKI